MGKKLRKVDRFGKKKIMIESDEARMLCTMFESQFD